MHPVERNLAIARVTPASFASFRDKVSEIHMRSTRKGNKTIDRTLKRKKRQTEKTDRQTDRKKERKTDKQKENTASKKDFTVEEQGFTRTCMVNFLRHCTGLA